VVKCIADPSYDGKSFGVICLQGTAQANLIRNLLMDRIGVQQMQAARSCAAMRTPSKGRARRHFPVHGGGYE